MSHPYKPKCLNYINAAPSVASQAQAYDHCFTKMFSDLYSELPYNQVLTKHMTLKYTSLKEMLARGSAYRINITRMEKACTRKTKLPDCKREIYIPILRTAKDGRDPAIRILAPGLPQIVTTSVAKIEPIDYVTYILSCFSFWFAFSPLVFMTEGFVYNWVTSKLIRDQDSAKSLNELREKIVKLENQMEKQLDKKCYCDSAL